MKVRVKRFCLQCKTKELNLSQEKFCCRKCFDDYRKLNGWFYSVKGKEYKHSTNCQSASRSFISNKKGIGTTPKGYE